MRGNIAQLMQQAQRMQDNLQRAQEDIAKLEATGSSGGGLVSVTIGGRKDCRKVRIDPSAISDPEMLEDLVAAAFNDAVGKIDAESRAMMDSATAGMPAPATALISGLTRTRPSTREYSVCRRRWTKGWVMGGLAG